jgi:hypothetical protein
LGVTGGQVPSVPSTEEMCVQTPAWPHSEFVQQSFWQRIELPQMYPGMHQSLLSSHICPAPTWFGAAWHTGEPSFAIVHASPLAASQPKFVIGSHTLEAGKHLPSTSGSTSICTSAPASSHTLTGSPPPLPVPTGNVSPLACSMNGTYCEAIV